MEPAFRAALAAYKSHAAVAFHQARQARAAASDPHAAASPPRVSPLPFERASFPALTQYLSDAAEAYQDWKRRPRVSPRPTAAPQKLGSGQLVHALFASLRRDRWLESLAKRAHFVRTPPAVPVMQIIVCGIPHDVRRSAHRRFMTRKAVREQCAAQEHDYSSSPALGTVHADQLPTVCLAFITKDDAYLVHITRCRLLYSEGKTTLHQPQSIAPPKLQDNCDDVKKRYLGKPDEMYRRKTARKFARWRRKQRELHQEKLAAELRAEKEMKRRRGYDHRLTIREARDSTFAPFLFDSSCNAYAYSSKITEAPKLRKVMVTKYSDVNQSSNEQPDQWQRAREAAETNPLFHTRVMNRFA